MDRLSDLEPRRIVFKIWNLYFEVSKNSTYPFGVDFGLDESLISDVFALTEDGWQKFDRELDDWWECRRPDPIRPVTELFQILEINKQIQSIQKRILKVQSEMWNEAAVNRRIENSIVSYDPIYLDAIEKLKQKERELVEQYESLGIQFH